MDKKYLNARPSELKNIGEDVKGAQRHNFLTYEQKQEKKKQSKEKAEIKAELEGLKQLALAEMTLESVLKYYTRDIQLKHGFTSELYTEMGSNLRRQIQEGEIEYALYEKKFRALRKYSNICRRLGYSPRNVAYYLEKLKGNRTARKAIKEENGRKLNWKEEAKNGVYDSDISWLVENTRAVQFGNSVTDAERAYIICNTTEQLKIFKDTFPNFNLKAIGFSFGARGKAGSVAYYQDNLKVISVNRNNVGSLIHELGHAIDYSLGLVSDDLPIEIKRAYSDTLREKNVDPHYQAYLLKKVEIFARLFEAHCESLKVFSSFSLFTGFSHLPELGTVEKEYFNKYMKQLGQGE